MAAPAACAAESNLGPRNTSLALFAVSVLGLFLELMLIRWVGTEIRIFAYLQNTVLIVCFLGLGLGCLTCRRPVQMQRGLLALLALAVILAVPACRAVMAKITDLLSVLGDFLIWENAISQGAATTLLRVSMGLALTFVLMALLWEVFVPLGRVLGRLIDDHPRTIWAYSVNVAGSLAGIWLFVALSAWSLAPWIWLAVAAALLALFVDADRRRWPELALLCSLPAIGLLAGNNPGALETRWSPYQKLELVADGGRNFAFPGQVITVNNAGYQAMIDLAPEAVARNPKIPPEERGWSQYDLPTRFAPRAEDVLIVGAGSGNDVAGVLRGDAQRVVAVEIDPVIIEMGRANHPERPYNSPKVQVVNDDARSYFATTDRKFDLIVFGLLDSHTTTAMTNARLDHYVYTRESLERAKSLLKPGGVMVLSFEAQKLFIADRMARCLRDVFGAAPLAFRIPSGPSGWGGTFFVVGQGDRAAARLAADPALAQQVAAWQAASPLELTYSTGITTDDWPYIYLERPSVPTLYLLLGGLLAALLVYSRRRLGPGLFAGLGDRAGWTFFFMGAAFLLLEVQNISKASVALGNTWLVNAVIISGVLVMILLSNLAAACLPSVPRVLAGALLLGSCLGLYFVDLASFGGWPFWAKSLAVGGLATLPMFFAGLLFIDLFRQAENKHAALGANLLGSLAGGLLQSVTFLVGIKALLLVTAGLYVVALVLMTSGSKRRRADRGTKAQPELASAR
ncbi:MAG: methyltransferase domain-containing protein [Pirellulales bacterium]